MQYRIDKLSSSTTGNILAKSVNPYLPTDTLDHSWIIRRESREIREDSNPESQSIPRGTLRRKRSRPTNLNSTPPNRIKHPSKEDQRRERTPKTPRELPKTPETERRSTRYRHHSLQAPSSWRRSRLCQTSKEPHRIAKVLYQESLPSSIRYSRPEGHCDKDR